MNKRKYEEDIYQDRQTGISFLSEDSSVGCIVAVIVIVGLCCIGFGLISLI